MERSARRTCLIDGFPVLRRKSFSRDRFHPVPVDAREVGDLAELEIRARLRDSEPVSETSWIALPRGASADADVLASSLLSAPGRLWHVNEVISALAVRDGRAPQVKGLCPSIEISGGSPGV